MSTRAGAEDYRGHHRFKEHAISTARRTVAAIDTLDIVEASLPGVVLNGKTFVSAGSVVTWLLACAARSSEVPANTCKELAEAIERWTVSE